MQPKNEPTTAKIEFWPNPARNTLPRIEPDTGFFVLFSLFRREWTCYVLYRISVCFSRKRIICGRTDRKRNLFKRKTNTQLVIHFELFMMKSFFFLKRKRKNRPAAFLIVRTKKKRKGGEEKLLCDLTTIFKVSFLLGRESEKLCFVK